MHDNPSLPASAPQHARLGRQGAPVFATARELLRHSGAPAPPLSHTSLARTRLLLSSCSSSSSCSRSSCSSSSPTSICLIPIFPPLIPTRRRAVVNSALARMQGMHPEEMVARIGRREASVRGRGTVARGAGGRGNARAERGTHRQGRMHTAHRTAETARWSGGREKGQRGATEGERGQTEQAWGGVARADCTAQIRLTDQRCVAVQCVGAW